MPGLVAEKVYLTQMLRDEEVEIRTFEKKRAG
jgi:hypothetical protein